MLDPQTPVKGTPHNFTFDRTVGSHALAPPVNVALAGHDRHGALANERDGHRVGADAVARDTAGGTGSAQESGVSAVEATIPARATLPSRVCSSRGEGERPCRSSAGRPPP